MSERKTRYAEFCRLHYVPMHLQPWWLDAVCRGGTWDVCLATDKGNGMSGALPYFIRRRWGLRIIGQPPLTSYGGPWLCPPEDTYPPSHKRADAEKKLLETLIRELPKVDFFQQNFRPEIAAWLPFYRAGFQQTTRYTYLFSDLSDVETIRAGFKNTLRTDIKKAARHVRVIREPDVPAVWQLHLKSFMRKGRRPPYDFETFRSLHEALAERDRSACFIARDLATNAPHAALCLAFDERRASVLLTGQDPACKSFSAVWLLFWEAIKFCSERGLSLDFEGSMEKNIERGFRAFGAQLTPYHRVWKAGNRLLDLAYRFYLTG